MDNRFEEFSRLIALIDRDIEKLKTETMKKYDLNRADVMSLCHLAMNPEGLTATELCKLTISDKAAMSRVLLRLQNKGYIYYPEAGTRKKYRSVAKLTDKGQEIMPQIELIIEDIVAQVGIDDIEKRSEMYEALKTIADNLEGIVNSSSFTH